MKKYANTSVWLLLLLSALLLLASCTDPSVEQESETNTDTGTVTVTDTEAQKPGEEESSEAADNGDCAECDFGQWITTKNPTCKAEGQKQRTCGVCGRIEYDTVGKAGHAYGDWLMVRSPSLDREGTEERVCADCGETDTRAIAKLTAVQSFEDLKVCLENGDSAILLTTDIVLTDTIFVTGESTIYVKEDHVLTRSPEFLGDLFVLGEDAEGKNAILSGTSAKLTLRTENGATLTFDGNKDNITGDVHGTAFWLTNSAELNMYDGVVLQNCRKTANQRTQNNDAFTTPDKVGGAVVIIENGAFNMYGGLITSNEVNTLVASTVDEDAESTGENSTWGGAIFNRSTFNMYGGTISDNKAARGAAVCNYRSCYFYGGTVENNQATVYGGAIYQPSSQYSASYFGDMNSEDPAEVAVTFRGNCSGKSGGAVFAAHQSCVLIYGNTLFEGNQSLAGNGGAINVAGELTVQYAHFKNNQAFSKGGAIYGYYSEKGLETRVISLNGGLFEGNRAPRGGAVSLAAGDDVNKGAEAIVGNVIFRKNVAYVVVDEATGEAEYGRGGAIHMNDGSILTLTGEAQFIENESENNGGALYLSGGSKLTLAGESAEHPVLFRGNTAIGNGGAIYLYGGSTMEATDLTLVENTSNSTSYGGGALFMSDGSKAAFHGTVLFDSNLATEKGGAIFAGGESNLSFTGIDDATFLGNRALNHGGAMFLTGAAKLTLTGDVLDDAKTFTVSDEITAEVPTTISFVGNTAGGSGGAIYLYTGASMRSADVTFAYNTATTNGGALYMSKAEDTDTETFASPSASLTDLLLSNNKAGGNGGAVALYRGTSVTLFGDITMTNNQSSGSDYGGGALYASDSTVTEGADGVTLTMTGNKANTGYGGAMALLTNSTLTVSNLTVTGNEADEHGGAIYLRAGSVLNVDELTAEDNTAAKSGGVVYATSANTQFNVTDMKATNNTATTANGGVGYITSGAAADIGTLTANNNTAAENGGVVALMSTDSSFKADVLSASLNSAAKGGVLYAEKLTATVGSMTLTSNTATGGGGAVYVTEGATLNATTVTVTDNQAGGNGGAMYIYTNAVVNIGTLTASGNTADGKNGGAIYASGASTTVIDSVEANGNSAKQGGFLYLTTTDSAFTVKAGSVADNTATDGGASIWVNSKKANLYIEQDVDTPICDAADIEGASGFAVKDYVAA